MKEKTRFLFQGGASLLCYLVLSLPSAQALEQSTERGPDIVIIEGESKSVYEYSQNGRLRVVKVVPVVGPPYYLVPADPTEGDGDLLRADKLNPSWRLIEF